MIVGNTDRYTRSPMLSEDDQRRFWQQVETPDDGCWLWPKTGRAGYASFTAGGRSYPAHRVSYALANGPIPPGLLVCHSCHNKACVRPDHLHAGTQVDNVIDEMDRRGDLRADTLSLGEVARMLGTTRVELRKEISRGNLAGRAWPEYFVTVDEVERYRRDRSPTQ